MTLEDVNQRIKNAHESKYEAELDEADLHFLSLSDCYYRNTVSGRNSTAYNPKRLNKEHELVKRIEARINNSESFNQFVRNYTTPHNAQQIISKCWVDNFEVFKARDKFSYAEKNGEVSSIDFDFDSYAKSVFWDLYKYNPNSVIAILKNPDGVFTLEVNVSDILYIDEDCETNTIKSIIFQVITKDESLIYSFQEDGYQIFLESQGIATAEIVGLEKYWSTENIPVSRVSTRKKTPQSKIRINYIQQYQGALEDLFYYRGLQKVTDPFSFMLVTEQIVPNGSCEFNDETRVCQGGYLYDKNTGYALIDKVGSYSKCPICATSPSVGMINRIEFSKHQGLDNPSESMHFVNPDPSILKYGDEKIKALENSFYKDATGIDQEKQKQSLVSAKTAAEVLEGMRNHAAVLEQIKSDIQTPLQNLYSFVVDIELGEANTTYQLGSDYMTLTREDALILKEKTDALGNTRALGIDRMLISTFSDGNTDNETRGHIITELNYILGENLDKTLSLYEIQEDSILSQVAQGIEANDIIANILKFSQTIKENDNEENQEGTNNRSKSSQLEGSEGSGQQDSQEERY